MINRKLLTKYTHVKQIEVWRKKRCASCGVSKDQNLSIIIIVADLSNRFHTRLTLAINFHKNFQISHISLYIVPKLFKYTFFRFVKYRKIFSRVAIVEFLICKECGRYTRTPSTASCWKKSVSFYMTLYNVLHRVERCVNMRIRYLY